MFDEAAVSRIECSTKAPTGKGQRPGKETSVRPQCGLCLADLILSPWGPMETLFIPHTLLAAHTQRPSPNTGARTGPVSMLADCQRESPEFAALFIGCPEHQYRAGWFAASL